MATLKISEMTEADLPLDGTEDIEIVQNALTKRCSTQDIADLAGLGYQRITFLVTYNGSAFTIVNLKNDAIGTTYTFTNPSNGKFRCTATDAIFLSGKAFMVGSSLNNAGTPYFLTGQRLSNNIFDFDMILHDGTQSGTPSITGVVFEIRIYP